MRLVGVLLMVLVISAHVGSPDVIFAGKAGAYDVRIVIRPPQVVPGVARVTVRAPSDVERVTIRPVFWRAGSKGAPSADETRRLEGQAGTFEGSLWLMARGAYTVDVGVSGPRGTGNVLVPVASIATGRLAMNPMLGALLAALGLMLCAGLVTIVYKGAGESLVGSGDMDAGRRSRARQAAAIAVPIIALAVFGGARWWGAVDRDYQRSIYAPSPLELTVRGSTLHLQATDTVWQPPSRPSALVPDHGKLMHLFLVKASDAKAFAHLHPQPQDSSAVPAFRATLPPLPGGQYNVFADVVHETGFERTLVGAVALAAPVAGTAQTLADPDDAWYAGEAARERTTGLADGTSMEIEIVPNDAIQAGRDVTIRVRVTEPGGKPARLEPYLGMSAHAVVARVDGRVYVHLHPMGTVTVAAQEAFAARNRGDTTDSGRLQLDATHSMHTVSESAVEFPYAFPSGGNYRLFVQVKRNGRILTGAFAIAVAEAAGGATRER